MVHSLSNLGPTDWAVLGVLVLVPLIMVFGIYSIRKEMRTAARVEAKSIKLKTDPEKRQRWRQTTTSQDLLNLLDDIETLLSLTNADEEVHRKEHTEAVHLSWMSYHIPIRTALLGSLLLAGALSAILMVVAQGPHNPMP